MCFERNNEGMAADCLASVFGVVGDFFACVGKSLGERVLKKSRAYSGLVPEAQLLPVTLVPTALHRVP